MNFSTKFSLLSLLLIFSMATPSRAMVEAEQLTTEISQGAQELVASESLATGVVELAKTMKAEGRLQKLKHLPSKAQKAIKNTYDLVKQECLRKGGEFFALANANKEQGLGIMVTAAGITYIVHRISDKALKFVPMTDATKAKYRNWIKGGLIVVGLGTSAALEYYGKGFNYILAKNRKLGYAGLAVTLAIALVYESSSVRNFLSNLPKIMQQLPSQVKDMLKQVPGKVKAIPGAIKRNKAKTAAGAGLTTTIVASGIALKRVGFKGIKDMFNNKVMPIVSKYSSAATKFVTDHPRITKVAGVAVAAGTLGYAGYKYGYKKLNTNARLGVIEKEITKGNLSTERKAALNTELNAMKAATAETLKTVLSNPKNRSQYVAASVILPLNEFNTRITALQEKLV